MSYCPHCGGQLLPDAAYCPYCGQPSAAALPGAVNEPVMPEPGAPDHSLVLVSIGSCPRSRADDVLEDLLGYTKAEAKLIMQTAPTQIAQGLTMQQAQFLAQALTEYGMQVVVYCGANVVDLGQYATGSVFNSDGSFLNGVLAVLATLGVSNRLRRFTRWARPTPLLYLFKPRYRVIEPRHIRRVLRRATAPAPAPAPHPSPVRRAPTPARTRDDRSPAGGNRGPSGGSRGLGAQGFGLVSGNRSSGSGARGPGGIVRGSGSAGKPSGGHAPAGRSGFGGGHGAGGRGFGGHVGGGGAGRR